MDALAPVRPWQMQVADELGVPPVAPEAGLDTVHHWFGHTVWPLLGEDDLARLHCRAAAGERVAEAEWRDALTPALTDLYRRVYPYGAAYATASSAAHKYALAHGYDDAGAAEYGETYAAMNTGDNQRVLTAAGARATASLTARAFATGDANAYALTWPGAVVRACVLAVGDQARDRIAAGLRDSAAQVSPSADRR